MKQHNEPTVGCDCLECSETIQIRLDFCKLDSTNIQTMVFNVRMNSFEPMTAFVDEAYELLEFYLRGKGWGDYEVVNCY